MRHACASVSWTMKPPRLVGLQVRPVGDGPKGHPQWNDERGCHRSAPFVTRVSPHSNLGDDPSRGRFDELETLGAKRTPLSDSLIIMLCTTNASPTREFQDGAM